MEAVAARPRKAELTLTRILDAALDCYVRQGIGATTLEDVARAAGVGRSTLYRYVDNRDDLAKQEADAQPLKVARDELQSRMRRRRRRRSGGAPGADMITSLFHAG